MFKLESIFDVQTDEWAVEFRFSNKSEGSIWYDKASQLVVSMAKEPSTYWPLPFDTLIKIIEQAQTQCTVMHEVELCYQEIPIGKLWYDEQSQLMILMAETPLKDWTLPCHDFMNALKLAKAELIDAIETDIDDGY